MPMLLRGKVTHRYTNEAGAYIVEERTGYHVSAQEYAEQIGASVSTARRRLEAMVWKRQAVLRYTSEENVLNYRKIGFSGWLPPIRRALYFIFD